VVVRPAAIAHVADLNHDGLVQLPASLALEILELFSHLLNRLLVASRLRSLLWALSRFVSLLSNTNINVVDLYVLWDVDLLIVLRNLAERHVSLRFGLLSLFALPLLLLTKVLLLLGSQLVILLFVHA